MAQAWFWEKQKRILFWFEEPTEPSLPVLGYGPLPSVTFTESQEQEV